VRFEFHRFDESDLCAAKDLVVEISMLIFLVVKELANQGEASLGHYGLSFDVSDEMQDASLPIRVALEQPEY
jgi:hypothetical protein